MTEFVVKYYQPLETRVHAASIKGAAMIAKTQIPRNALMLSIYDVDYVAPPEDPKKPPRKPWGGKPRGGGTPTARSVPRAA